MKNVIRISLLPFLLCFCFFSFAFAKQNAEFPSAFDQEQVCERILTFVNTTFIGDGLKEEISLENIQLDNAYKIFVGTDLFNLDTDNYDNVKQQLNQGTYIYELPIYVDNGTIVANLSIIPELTEEEYAELPDGEEFKAKAGTWDITAAFGYFPPDNEFKDYFRVAEDLTGITDQEPLLVGGLRCFTRMVAIYADNNGVLDKIVVFSPDAVNWDELGIKQYTEPGVLDFKSVKSTIQALPPLEIDENVTEGYGSSNSHSSMQLGIVTGAGLLLVLMFYVYFRKQRRNPR